MVHFRLQFHPPSALSLINQRFDDATQALRQAVLTSSTPYVPYRTGALSNSGTVTEDGVVWTADYAQKCYYAKRPFSKTHHPLAQAGWFEAAKAVDLDTWCQTAVDLLTRKAI